MTPAERVINILGGADAVADICGVHRTRVFRWTYDRARGGTGGLIPAQHQQTLLDFARANGLDLKPDDFFEPVSTHPERRSDSETGVAA